MQYEIKNLKHTKGSIFDLDTAEVVMEDGRVLDVTYNRVENNLIVHQWYNLDELEHKVLRQELSRFFRKNRYREAS